MPSNDDITCVFSIQISSILLIPTDVGVISHLFVKAYHDGFSIKWDGHNFTDNEGTTYYLQKACGGEDFRPLCRGSSTKYNDKETLQHGQPYR